MRGLGLGFANTVGTGGVCVGRVSMLRWWGVGRWIGPGYGGVVLCL